MTKRKTTQTPTDTQTLGELRAAWESIRELDPDLPDLEDWDLEQLHSLGPQYLADLGRGGLPAQYTKLRVLEWHRKREQLAKECDLDAETLIVGLRELDVCQQARAVSATIHKLAAPRGKVPEEQGSLFGWCGYPTDMARVSPFFPMARDELNNRPFLRDFIITAAAWGEIAYTGPMLSTFEDDVLVVLLAALQRQGPHRKDSYVEGSRTYTYCGPMLPLLRALGFERPAKHHYRRFLASLKLMAVAGLDLRIAARTKAGKRKEARFSSMSAMLAHVAWDETAKILTVTVNPFFYETYADKTVTQLDVKRRLALKGSIAKSLYRFVQSHTKNPVFEGHYRTLAQVSNMDLEQPAFELRRQLKRAITELVGQGILTGQSRFVAQDIVKLYSADTVKNIARRTALPKGK